MNALDHLAGPCVEAIRNEQRGGQRGCRSDKRFDALLLGAAPALLWDETRKLVDRIASFPLTAVTLLVLLVGMVLHAPLMPSFLSVLFPLLMMGWQTGAVVAGLDTRTSAPARFVSVTQHKPRWHEACTLPGHEN